ncbi:glycoside hydrolase [Rhizoclosmatium globosum]|uniref:Glycoside hydrolase n=1 Tax=Rhizoclosmatium globosum TaxID=329046 RepID=A0A1Y2B919_9FUNG|nr:glycoside hydrolase [Rhizoclosmatium globosum]|eukprot:ORY31186.1 glycoside hydrolase [Rhizoclosmatium globosum]
MATSSVEAAAEIAVDSKDQQAIQTRKRNKYIIIGVAAVVLVTAASLIGYFASRPKDSTSNPVSPSQNATATATATAAVNSTQSTAKPGLSRRKLYGYYGANAMANGVDITRGTLPPPPQSQSYLYQRPLKYYCDTGYFDTINLAFLNLFGGGNGEFTITFGAFNQSQYAGTYVYKGDGKETNGDWTVQSYLNLGKDIQYCQNVHSVKVVMSLGGDKISAYSFSAGDGKRYAKIFYDMFLDGNGPVRPFGPGVKLDGIELDIEKNPANVYPTYGPSPWNQEMIDCSQTCVHSVVPQCYLGNLKYLGKDENVGDVISGAAKYIDYLIVQYYNNPQCSYPFNFNFDAWTKLYPGPIVVGLAGDWTSAISGGFLEPGPLQAVYDMIKNSPQFGGFSVYDVSSSTPPATSAQSNADLSTRCGGTWIHANSVCSMKKCDPYNPQCGPNMGCFMFLANC